MMKKLLLSIAVLIVVATTASAQKGKMAVGGSLSYGSEIESLGIGGRFYYNILDQLRIAPNTTFYIPNDNTTAWDISGDVHYLFPMQDKITLYPLGGLVLTGWSWDAKINGDRYSNTETRFGLNMGGGIQFDLTKNLSLFGELKYVIVSDFDQLVISSGVTYSF